MIVVVMIVAGYYLLRSCLGTTLRMLHPKHKPVELQTTYLMSLFSDCSKLPFHFINIPKAKC